MAPVALLVLAAFVLLAPAVVAMLGAGVLILLSPLRVVSFRQWLRYGIPTAALSRAISAPYLLLRYT